MSDGKRVGQPDSASGWSAVFLTDLDRRISFWDGSAERLYGYSPENAVGQGIQDLLGSGDGAAMTSAQDEALSQGAWLGRLILRTRSGRALEVQVGLHRLTGPAGEPESVLVLSRPAQSRASLLFSPAETASSIIGRGLGHDLNNVLSNLLLYTDLVKNETMAKEPLEMLVSMERSVERGIDIVRLLMSLAGREAQEPIPLNLKYLANGVRKLANREFADNLNVVTDYPADLWIVSADPAQICWTLLDRCLDAALMGEGSTLTVQLENLSPDQVSADGGEDRGPCVRLVVSVAGHRGGAAREVGAEEEPARAKPGPPHRQVLLQQYYPMWNKPQEI